MVARLRSELLGSALALGSACVLSALMLPLRSHISTATVALVLVVPVVGGVAAGGLVAGTVGLVAGFLIYDFVFIPPYYTLDVGAGQNWTALGVYAVVMVVVSRVVVRLQAARAAAMRGDAEARRLLELSELLVADRPLTELLQGVVDTVLSVSGYAGAALLLPDDSGEPGAATLTVVAASGEPIAAGELAVLQPSAGSRAAGRPLAVSMAGTGWATSSTGRNGGRVGGRTSGGAENRGAGSGAEPDVGPAGLRTLALSTAGRPVGLLAMRGPLRSGSPRSRRSDDEARRAVLQLFANQAAVAIERAQLRELALHTEAVEEADRLRRALLAVVSHDLRTPLSTMKVASTTLLDSATALPPESRTELYELLDSQTDRLSRLVSGLLDLSRYQAGALQLEAQATSVAELVDDALEGLRATLADRPVNLDLADDLPPLCADRVLLGQVLVNLLDNADRHSPPGTPILVTARRGRAEPGRSSRVEIDVVDAGPGVPAADRAIIFDSFQRADTGGRAGLGLWICKTFVEAHGGTIGVVEPEGTETGACFSFTIPLPGDGPGTFAGAGSTAEGRS